MFYEVHVFNGEKWLFFKEIDNALDALWQAYLRQMNGDETDEEIDDAKKELEAFWMIESVGIIYTRGFSD